VMSVEKFTGDKNSEVHSQDARPHCQGLSSTHGYLDPKVDDHNKLVQ
jgi:hypothetical protein